MKENFVVYQLKTLENLIHRAVDKKYCNHDHKHVSMIQIQIVHFLLNNEDKDIYQKNIEKRFDIRRSTVSGVLFNMEKHGIVHRIKQGVQKKIILSDSAKKQAKEIKKEMINFDLLLKKNIKQEKLDIFFEVIEQIKVNIEEEIK